MQTALFNLPAGVLPAWANAGAGEPTVAPLPTGQDAFSFYDQCSSTAGWYAVLVASGKPIARGSTLGPWRAAGHDAIDREFPCEIIFAR